MPMQTFEKVMKFIGTAPSKSREPLMRLYCYIYFQDAFFSHQFQRSQYDIAAELRMDLSDVNRRLQLLVNEGLIERSGKFRYAGEKVFAYYHHIPFNDRCGENLFANN